MEAGDWRLVTCDSWDAAGMGAGSISFRWFENEKTFGDLAKDLNNDSWKGEVQLVCRAPLTPPFLHASPLRQVVPICAGVTVKPENSSMDIGKRNSQPVSLV